jgi:hypothetical protein
MSVWKNGQSSGQSRPHNNGAQESAGVVCEARRQDNVSVEYIASFFEAEQ